MVKLMLSCQSENFQDQLSSSGADNPSNDIDIIFKNLLVCQNDIQELKRTLKEDTEALYKNNLNINENLQSHLSQINNHENLINNYIGNNINEINNQIKAYESIINTQNGKIQDINNNMHSSQNIYLEKFSTIEKNFNSVISQINETLIQSNENVKEEIQLKFKDSLESLQKQCEDLNNLYNNLFNEYSNHLKNQEITNKEIIIKIANNDKSILEELEHMKSILNQEFNTNNDKFNKLISSAKENETLISNSLNEKLDISNDMIKKETLEKIQITQNQIDNIKTEIYTVQNIQEDTNKQINNINNILNQTATNVQNMIKESLYQTNQEIQNIQLENNKQNLSISQNLSQNLNEKIDHIKQTIDQIAAQADSKINEQKEEFNQSLGSFKNQFNEFFKIQEQNNKIQIINIENLNNSTIDKIASMNNDLSRFSKVLSEEIKQTNSDLSQNITKNSDDLIILNNELKNFILDTNKYNEKFTKENNQILDEMQNNTNIKIDNLNQRQNNLINLQNEEIKKINDSIFKLNINSQFESLKKNIEGNRNSAINDFNILKVKIENLIKENTQYYKITKDSETELKNKVNTKLFFEFQEAIEKYKNDLLLMIGSIKTDLHQQNTLINNSQKELLNLNNEVKEAVNKKSFNEYKKENNSIVESVKVEIAKTLKVTQEQENKLSNWSNRFTELESAINQINKNLNNSEEKEKSKDMSIKKIFNEINNIQKNTQPQIENLMQDMRVLKNDLNKYNDELLSKITEIRKFGYNNNNIKTDNFDIMSLQKEFQMSKDLLSQTMELQNQSLKMQINSLDNKMQDLMKTISSQNASEQQMKTQINQLQEKYSELEKRPNDINTSPGSNNLSNNTNNISSSVEELIAVKKVSEKLIPFTKFKDKKQIINEVILNIQSGLFIPLDLNNLSFLNSLKDKNNNRSIFLSEDNFLNLLPIPNELLGKFTLNLDSEDWDKDPETQVIESIKNYIHNTQISIKANDLIHIKVQKGKLNETQINFIKKIVTKSFLNIDAAMMKVRFIFINDSPVLNFLKKDSFIVSSNNNELPIVVSQMATAASLKYKYNISQYSNIFKLLINTFKNQEKFLNLYCKDYISLNKLILAVAEINNMGDIMNRIKREVNGYRDNTSLKENAKIKKLIFSKIQNDSKEIFNSSNLYYLTFQSLNLNLKMLLSAFEQNDVGFEKLKKIFEYESVIFELLKSNISKNQVDKSILDIRQSNQQAYQMLMKR
jgi:hypothetical protein